MLTEQFTGLITLRVRTAQEQDLDAITALWQERQVLLEQANPRFRSPKRNEWQAALRTRIQQDTPLVYVSIDADEQIVGYVMGRLLGSEVGVIDEIALDAHRYHGGAGRALVQRLCSAFVDRRVLIVVPRHYAVEQAFWRSLGAQKTLEVVGDDWQIPQEFMWMTL